MSKIRYRDGLLIGIGLDNEDGHKRITRSENFVLAGGSEETHGRMTETALKTMETLEQRGKTLGNVEPEELKEIIHNARPG